MKVAWLLHKRRRAGRGRMACADVIALDHVAEAVRAQLGVSAEAFPLARVLEGGT